MVQFFHHRIQLPVLIDLLFIISFKQVLHVSMHTLLTTSERVATLLKSVNYFDHLLSFQFLFFRLRTLQFIIVWTNNPRKFIIRNINIFIFTIYYIQNYSLPFFIIGKPSRNQGKSKNSFLLKIIFQNQIQKKFSCVININHQLNLDKLFC